MIDFQGSNKTNRHILAAGKLSSLLVWSYLVIKSGMNSFSPSLVILSFSCKS